MPNSFPKKQHLRTQRDFQSAYGEGVKVYSKLYTLFLRENGRDHARLGLSVRKKFGSAPQRNRFKRHMRELFRTHQAQIFPPVDIIVIPGREASSADYATLQRGFRELLGL